MTSRLGLLSNCTREISTRVLYGSECFHFEASIDSSAGMAAVADVVLNRVRDHCYPNTVCEVVPVSNERKLENQAAPGSDDSERKYICKTPSCPAGTVMVK